MTGKESSKSAFKTSKARHSCQCPKLSAVTEIVTFECDEQ